MHTNAFKWLSAIVVMLFGGTTLHAQVTYWISSPLYQIADHFESSHPTFRKIPASPDKVEERRYQGISPEKYRENPQGGLRQPPRQEQKDQVPALKDREAGVLREHRVVTTDQRRSVARTTCGTSGTPPAAGEVADHFSVGPRARMKAGMPAVVAGPGDHRIATMPAATNRGVVLVSQEAPEVSCPPEESSGESVPGDPFADDSPPAEASSDDIEVVPPVLSESNAIPAPGTPARLQNPAASVISPDGSQSRPVVGGNRPSAWCFRQAERHACWAGDLARRGAAYAARAEYWKALGFVAEGLDANGLTSKHSTAFTAGRTTLREADDFVPRFHSLAVHVDSSAIVRRHRTPVLRVLDPGDVPQSQEAIARYLAYAQDELLKAVNNRDASDIFHGLGMVHAILAQQQNGDLPLSELKAAAFFQLALRVNPRDHRIADDLGVFCARSGHLEQARALFEQSLSVKPRPLVLRNLASVYEQLGETRLAERAYQGLHELGPLSLEDCTGDLIQWVDPATFAALRPGSAGNWGDAWDTYRQGQYVGNVRLPHVPEYRLRVDDVVQFVFRQIRTVSSEPYRLTVGDQIHVRSMSKPAEVNSGAIVVQPDGMISLPLVGQVSAAGYSVEELRDELDKRYRQFFQSPAMVVTPVKLNTRVQDFLDAVDRRFTGVGGGGQERAVLVLPDGTISLPAIGTLCAQGLTVPELGYEVNERYHQILEGVTATPALFQRAPRYAYVLGEVARPGRYELVAPTSVSQAISLAGSWNVGANLRHVIILRRGEDWRLMGCAVNMNTTLNRRPVCPHNDMWLADSDVVIVLKGDLIKANNLIDQVFTRGIYAVFPLSFSRVVD